MIKKKELVPFNLALHEHLMTLGYKWRRYDAYYEDVGTRDSGPLLRGNPSYDEYEGFDDLVFSGEDGTLDQEMQDHALVLWLMGHDTSSSSSSIH